MAKPRVLDVGNCRPDHAAIRHLLSSKFDAEIAQAHGPSDTLKALKESHFDLVLINRKLDQDYTDGIEILKLLKSDEKLGTIPVMLITNYPDHQHAAVELGALRGFGKLELDTPETFERLSAVLA